MKTQFIFLISILVIVAACAKQHSQSNNQDIPDNVQKNFKSDFSTIEDAEWEFEDGLYEAEFEENGLERTVIYDADGNRVATETEFPVDDLSEVILNYISDNYTDAEIEEAETVESTDGNFTVVEIEMNDDQEIELFFDTDGNFVKQVEETDEAEDAGDDTEEEETETAIEISQLPQQILDYLDSNYAACSINEAELEETAGGTFYEVELQDGDGNQFDVIFDADGNFVEVEED